MKNSSRSFNVTFVLLLFFGLLGVHRFYVGRPWSGLLYLCTFGFWGFGVLLDLVMLVTGRFTDGRGYVVQ
jgi:TM2 domain-containing membrane protein YozV